ncbi:MAG TPA: M3 family oligoendopeptidase, partial [Herpetosiphonaceae bacterium]
MPTERIKLDPQDWATVQPAFDQLLAEPLSAATVGPWLERWSGLDAQLKEYEYQSWRLSTENTADEAAERRLMHFLEELQPKIEQHAQRLKEKLLAADLSALPADTAQMLRRFRTEAALFREANLPLSTEIQRLSTEYDKLIGAMAIELDGKTMTMPQAMTLLQDPDRALRERVWRAVQDRYLQDRAALDELFLKMLPLRRQQARNADLPSYIEYVWGQYGRFDYTPEDCRTFHAAIESEIVPLARAYAARRREQLGVETLRPWDLDVDPLGRPALAPFGDVAELEDGCQRMFDQLDPALGDQFRRMRDGFLDLDSRPNKAPGGYCSFMMDSKVPYIFMNAAGVHDDVQTLLHEGGHAFHATESALKQRLIWNYNGPIEFCEVASMAMEHLAAPYLERSKGGFYAPADARRARAEHLQGTLTFFPYMAVVDAFQHWVYAEAPEDVSAADLDAKWGELWDRFMDGADWTGLEDVKVSGWHRKMHIYSSPLYYVEYGLA